MNKPISSQQNEELIKQEIIIRNRKKRKRLTIIIIVFIFINTILFGVLAAYFINNRPTEQIIPTPPPVASVPIQDPQDDLEEIPSDVNSGDDSNFDAEVVADTLNTPWGIVVLPDGRVLFTERPGRVRVIENDVLLPDPWANIPAKESEEAGLMGIAIDSQFSTNKYVYLSYAADAGDGNLKNVLARYIESSDGNGVLDKILLDNVPAESFRNGGALEIDLNDKIYWSIGDLTAEAESQNMAVYNGKVLRLNTDGSIPQDNPNPQSYIYTSGHRNVQGFGVQPTTGFLFVTEHGPSSEDNCCNDEINIIQPGANYGWPTLKGDNFTEQLLRPVYSSGPEVAWAPAGSTFIKNGPWKNSFVFTGLITRALYRAVFSEFNSVKIERMEEYLKGQYGRLRDVAEDADGNLYITTSNTDGKVNGLAKPDDDKVIKLTINN